jgi:two-component SAPR family response regulator
MEKKHIFLIENNENALQLFTDALEESNVDFLCSLARNTEQALKMLKNIVPDIIFIDVHMPAFSMQFIKTIRTIHDSHTVPMVFYSTLPQPAPVTNDVNAEYFLFLPRNVPAMTNILKNIISDLHHQYS